MSLKLNDYDSRILVAKNEKSELYIVKYGDVCSYYICDLHDPLNSCRSTVAQCYNYKNKTQLVTNAFNHATKDFDFIDIEVLSKYPRNLTITLSPSERVAINTAYEILLKSNSDNADQALCYLEKIKSKF